MHPTTCTYMCRGLVGDQIHLKKIHAYHYLKYPLHSSKLVNVVLDSSVKCICHMAMVHQYSKILSNMTNQVLCSIICINHIYKSASSVCEQNYDLHSHRLRSYDTFRNLSLIFLKLCMRKEHRTVIFKTT